MHKFKKLKIWQDGIVLVTDIYSLSNDFPQHELYGLTSQLRRAAVSVTLNIAEGSGSKSDAEFKRFLIMSLKSVYETLTILEISERLRYSSGKKISYIYERTNRLGAMINGLINKLSNKSNGK